MASIFLNQSRSMSFRLIFLIHLIFFQNIFVYHQTAQASDLFYVSDIRVNVKDTSAAQARLKAIAQGQHKAFKLLMAQLLSSEDQASLTPPSENQLNAMIQNFEVQNEKNSAVRYIGVFAFQFNPKKVEEFLNQKGKTIVSTHSREKILVLPIFETDKKNLLWQEKNSWRNAWNQESDLTASYILPLGDLTDILEFPEQTALQKDFNRLQVLRERYRSHYILVTILKQGSPFELDLFLYDDKGLRFSEENLTLLGDTILTSKLLTSAIHKTIDVIGRALNEDEIEQKIDNNALEIQIFFQDYQEWLRIQKILSNTALIHSFHVMSLQKKRAVVRLEAGAAEKRIFQSLEKQGFDVAIIDKDSMSKKVELRLNFTQQQMPRHANSLTKYPLKQDEMPHQIKKINEIDENFYEALEQPS